MLIIIVVIIGIAFLFGLLSRQKGDGVLDTLGSGCHNITNIILIILAVIAACVYFNV